MRRTLEREGVRVLSATTGEQGLSLAREHHPDLITLDVLLGGVDGWDVLVELKADPQLAPVPVLMLTIMDDRSTGFALGAADYLTKPVDRRRLVQLVGRYAVRSTDTDRSILVIEDDASTREMMMRTVEQAGWDVIGASHGHEGLAQVAAQRPALILLDLMMPEMDGFTFLEQLRANRSWADIPVVVVTAMDLSSAIASG
ncbi:MAG: response regulator [Oscillochloris sp.]|nr:response regulator [Oscillochloris sp.]